MKFAIEQDLIEAPSRRRGGAAIRPRVRFLVAHDTGNPGSTARANVAYYKRTAHDHPASAHLFVDDREIIECIPAATAAPEKAWHVRYDSTADNQLFGVDANDAAIAVEYCYGKNINADAAYERYVWLLAYLCKQFNLNPRLDIVGHYLLDPARRTDPVTGLAASRRTYEQLLRDVPAEYQALYGPIDGFDALAQNVGRTVVSRVAVNVREGAPTTRVRVHHVLTPGSSVAISGATVDGEPVNGNPVWYQIGERLYVWSGAFR